MSELKTRLKWKYNQVPLPHLKSWGSVIILPVETVFGTRGCNSKLTTFIIFKAYKHYLWRAIAQLNQFSYISSFLKLNGTTQRQKPFKLEMNTGSVWKWYLFHINKITTKTKYLIFCEMSPILENKQETTDLYVTLDKLFFSYRLICSFIYT